jgi:hypothetical protein|tara:strand:+ start:92 stop:367 length:276 start_codon:yes stop_codon:yes gene_type:complete
MDVTQAISDYGFPIVATVGLLYMIYFIWSFITTKIKTRLGETQKIVVDLIDRIRLLDNDIIRLQQKLDTVIELREGIKKEDEKKKSNRKIK